MDLQKEVGELYKSTMTFFNVNLMFGIGRSYLLHYMAQCVKNGQIPESLASNTFKYSPVSTDDLAFLLVCESEIFGHDRIKTYTLNGKKEYTLKQMMNILEKALGKEENSTKLIKENASETISHNGNMIKMAEFFDKNTQFQKDLK